MLGSVLAIRRMPAPRQKRANTTIERRGSLLILLAFIAACSRDVYTGSLFARTGDSAPASGSGATGAGASAAVSGTVGIGVAGVAPIGPLGPPDPVVPACMPCSSDLHQVLDCTGRAVRTCPDDMGCSPSGECIAPCDSATANRSSIGCEYYVINSNAGALSGGCWAMFIANTWTTPVSVHAEFEGRTLDVSNSIYVAQSGSVALERPTYVALSGGVVPANQVGILFLVKSPNGPAGCPSGVTAAYTATDPPVAGTGKGHGFRITTSLPVSAFDSGPYDALMSPTGSATLLLPTSAWTKNYIAVSAYESGANGNSNLLFVASEDQTTLSINPVAAIIGGTGVATASKGAPATYVLDRGESIQFEQPMDLSGSAIMADKPIGAWGGHTNMQIPANSGGLSTAHQQLPPVSALGSEYVAVRYRSRDSSSEESVPWRLMGVVDGTTLTYEPRAPASAPITLNRGQVVELDPSPDPFVIKSQDAMHPFYFAGHMTSLDGIGLLIGGPETVNTIPPAQFMSRYVFFTDPTYPNTNLVVVRSQGGSPVSLDCVRVPLAGWQPIGSRYEYTRVDVRKDDATVGDCNNGRHEASSAAPFGLTVWGWGLTVAYGYPAGAAVRPINPVVVDTLR